MLPMIGMHCFTISTCETVPQFNGNLRTQFNEQKGHQRIRTIKTFQFEHARNDEEAKNTGSPRKKKYNMSDKSFIPIKDIYLQKLPLILTL